MNDESRHDVSDGVRVKTKSIQSHQLTLGN